MYLDPRPSQGDELLLLVVAFFNATRAGSQARAAAELLQHPPLWKGRRRLLRRSVLCRNSIVEGLKCWRCLGLRPVYGVKHRNCFVEGVANGHGFVIGVR